MIELTEELIYDAMRLAKIDQDKIIMKAKEIENGSKTPRARSVENKRTH